MSNEHQFHNPENLTPEQYEANKGWRLLTKAELVTKPEGVQYRSTNTRQWLSCFRDGVVADECSYRTRAPLPCAATGWIKISDRKPTEADLPVMFGAATCEGGKAWTQIFCGNLLMTDKSWTHWFPMNKIPEPPAPSESPDQLDYIARYGRPHDTAGFARMNGWLEGVRDERSFIRSIVDHYLTSNVSRDEMVERIIKRAG